jgi:TrmH family RNA methyltransferase
MGSAFRLPIWFGPTYDEALVWCSQRDIQTVCADAHAAKNFNEVEWQRPSALILGPESDGLSAKEMAAADETVRIPMRGAAESLNVAVATGVLLYEAARARD